MAEQEIPEGVALTAEQVRAMVRQENAAIKLEEQSACPHGRSAHLIDGKTGLVRCDDCGLEYMCNKPHVGGAAATRPEPSPVEMRAIEAAQERARKRRMEEEE